MLDALSQHRGLGFESQSGKNDYLHCASGMFLENTEIHPNIDHSISDEGFYSIYIKL